MSTPSGIPALIDQLKAVADVAFPLATSVVQVFDGPGNTADTTGQALHIGISDPTQLSPSADSTQEWPYASGVFRREEISITCLATAWSGDDDMKTLRDQCFAQIAALTTAVVADPTLNSTALMVRAVGANFALSQGYRDSQNNLEANVAFTVTAMQQFQN